MLRKLIQARTRRCFPGNRDHGRRRGTASSFQARQWMRSTSAWFRSPNARRMGAQRRPRSERYAAQQLNQLAVSRLGADSRTRACFTNMGHAREREQPEYPRRYKTCRFAPLSSISRLTSPLRRVRRGSAPRASVRAPEGASRCASVPPSAPLPMMMTSFARTSPRYNPTLLCIIPPSTKIVVAFR